MPDARESVKTIFGKVIEIQSDDERSKYLDQACAGDVSLRAELEDLLGAIERAGDFLGGSPPAVATIDQPISEKPGETIGPYKLLQQIGEGGMGIVFMAEQTEPIQRTVALKIIKPGMDTRQVIARFEAERQAVAMMDHPNIAKVLDAGTTDSGRPYFVMELVKGVPITKYCDEKHLPLRARLELFMQVCQAVQHAHQKGIIHRDIKPNNVLVAEYDNHPVPKVIDFGVAKATAQKLTERTMFTEFGQVLGTMEYMSPEQAKLNQLDVDTRSDIYSLGVLLYELLAGSTPFEGKRLHAAAFDEMLRIIREEEPPKPSTRLSSIDTLPSVAVNRHTEPARLSKDVRGELDWIVMKALEKDRNRRYETASGFAADIERHLHDEPVQARPTSAAYRFRKFARRNKGRLATVAGFAGLAALIAAVAATMLQTPVGTVQVRTDEELANQIEVVLNNGDQTVEVLKQGAFTVQLPEGIYDVQLKSTELRAILKQDRVVVRRNETTLVEVTRPRPIQRTGEPLLATLKGHEAKISGVAHAKSRKLLASSSSDGTIKLWDVETGALLDTLRGHEGEVRSVDFSADETTLASTGKDGKILFWDVAQRKLVRVFKDGMPDWSVLLYSPDGRTIASDGKTNHSVDLWNTETGELILSATLGDREPETFAFSPNGKLLAASSKRYISERATSGGYLALWDLETGKELWSVIADPRLVLSIGFSADGKTLATGNADHRVDLRSVESGAQIADVGGHGNAWVWSTYFSPDGDLLVSSAGEIFLWDVATKRKVAALPGHNSWTWVNFLDSRTLASWGNDGEIRLWDVGAAVRADGD